jgi:hypothetical protein
MGTGGCREIIIAYINVIFQGVGLKSTPFFNAVRCFGIAWTFNKEEPTCCLVISLFLVGGV